MKSPTKGADSDNSEVETGFGLSPQTEKNYQKVNQDFSAMFDGKSVCFCYFSIGCFVLNCIPNLINCLGL